jgi:hypothetical protein
VTGIAVGIRVMVVFDIRISVLSSPAPFRFILGKEPHVTKQNSHGVEYKKPPKEYAEKTTHWLALMNIRIPRFRIYRMLASAYYDGRTSSF